MTTFDVVAMLGGICGLLMVVGGMLLLYKGVITLSQASKEEAVSLEFKNTLKVSTHYPAIGLFVVGLAFIITAIWFSRSTAYQFKIVGHVKGLESGNPVQVLVEMPASWNGEAYDDGQIIASVTPKMDILVVRVIAPGYQERKIPIETKNSRLGELSLGDITLGTKLIQRPQVDSSNILVVSDSLPPISAQSAF
jgi:hypothetical protein